ncbi:hypothetical protein N9R88_00185 [Candidatus Pelagibacter sp.]|nr:hypothetical protein [Candidatus Pelagibacter sp.]
MVKNKFFFLSFFLFLIFLIIFRTPCFFLEGYWQIKGDNFYEYSAQNSFLKSLLYVYDYGGYFELTRNIVSKFATYFPIFSQLIDVYFSLLIYLAIFSYIYFSNSIIFNEKKYKILIIFLILFSPPMTPEIWLTVAHAKAYFGIFSFILLFQDFKNLENYKKIIYRFTLIFSGLSSIYASVFAPIYFLKFIIEKNKDSFLNFLCSLLPLVINLFTFIRFFSNANVDRFVFDINKIESFSYNILIRPFFGSSIPKFFHSKLNIENNDTIFIALFLLIIISIFFAYKIYQKKDKIIILIVASFLLQSSFVFIGSLYSDFVGGRYAVIPGIILLTLFIRLFQTEQSYLYRYLFAFLILMSLTTGLLEFKYFSPLPNIISCISV